MAEIALQVRAEERAKRIKRATAEKTTERNKKKQGTKN